MRKLIVWFDFVVDDSTLPDHLFLEDFEHDSGPA
jgi:hypothetical protein